MASFSGKVTGGSLAHRVNPPSGTNQGSIPNGTSLTVNTLASSDPYYSYRNEWFTTTYNGKSGYVMAKWIAITSGGSDGTITTATDPLNIRETPSSSATVSFKVQKGSTVRVLDTTAQSGFYRIGCSQGTGWGSTQYISVSGGSSGSGVYVGTFTGFAKAFSQMYSSAAVNPNSPSGYLNAGESRTFEQIGGNRGWVKHGGSYVQACLIGINPTNTTMGTGTASQKIYLRENPSPTESYFTTFNMGSKVVILDTTSVPEWVRVGTKEGIGWIEAYSVTID